MLVSGAPLHSLQTFKAEFFKALAHPLRIRVLEVLRGHERSVQELQAALDVDQPTVSAQLAVLKRQRRRGSQAWHHRYTLRDPLVGDLLDVARKIFDRHLVGTQGMLRALRQERRPARR